MQKVAPHLCFGCGKMGTTLCDNCKNNITTEPFHGCVLCGNVSSEGICAQHDASFCKAWVVSQRVTVLKRVINAYKFENVKAAAPALIDLMDSSLPLLPNNTVIVPIPTAASHVRQRGYDHLDVLARLLSQTREMPITRLLGRSSSKTQHHLNKADREKEARSTFRIKEGFSVDQSMFYLLLDDIVTTGATITSAAKVLADAGAKNIFVAALAYQPLD